MRLWKEKREETKNVRKGGREGKWKRERQEDGEGSVYTGASVFKVFPLEGVKRRGAKTRALY